MSPHLALRRVALSASPSLKASRSLPGAARALSYYNTSLAGLTTEQSDMREAVSAFAESKVQPRAQEIDRTNTSPRDLWPAMGQLGLLGVTVPESTGGAGRGYLDHTLVMEGR